MKYQGMWLTIGFVESGHDVELAYCFDENGKNLLKAVGTEHSYN
ncbi:hypothetical protein SAMN04487897_10458 [Paenibacillus sp. yr247]|nr:hypothetical protein SAMN04487897_10458 [Paenibacillus sp. yr247]